MLTVVPVDCQNNRFPVFISRDVILKLRLQLPSVVIYSMMITL